MNSLASWVSLSAMHALGWALVHFLWQGTAVGALSAVLMTFPRRAQVRYALGLGALLVMLVAPVATFLLLAQSGAPLSNPFGSPRAQWPELGLKAAISAGASRLSPSHDALPWLAEAWLLGVALLSVRSAGGVLLLERRRRKETDTVSIRLLSTCRALEKRLGLRQIIRYGECAWLATPAVAGWFRPIVLLPVTALTGLSDEQLEMIVAHELAHIQRLDAFVNVFQIAVETLLFYHPAVWWLNKRIRAEREHCCDNVAITLCGRPVEYARALALMEEWRGAPVLAMAANRGPLSERIVRVLGLKSTGQGIRGIGLAGGILCLAAALAAGGTLLGIAYPQTHARAASIAQVALGRFAWQSSQTASPSSSPAPTPVAKPSAGRVQSSLQTAPQAGGSYVDEMRAAGVGDVTVDQLIAMKIQGVTPEYVRGLHEQNLNPDPDTLVSMKIQGVTPEYVRAMHEQDLQPDADELVSMRIQSVTSDYVRDIHALGLKPTVDEFVSMRIQSVTPEYIKSLKAAGLTFSVDELISSKIQGVSPEFIDRVTKHGFKNLTLEKLIEIKRAGILESPADL